MTAIRKALFTSEYLGPFSYQSLLIFLFQFALPNTNDFPSSRREHFGDFLVSRHIAFELFVPKVLMFRRARVAAVMPVPKTTVHENSYFL